MMPKTLISAAFILLALPNPGEAQGTRGADLAADLTACRAIGADDARLACFDRAAAAVATAQRSGDLVILDRKAVVERRRRAFGLPAANAQAAADVRGADVKELVGVVRSSAPTRTPGRYLFRLEDGSAWEMLDPASPPTSGATVTISAIRLGGFRARVGTQRAFLVKRLR